jgi:hypothetical protein
LTVDLQGTGDSEGIITDELAIYLLALDLPETPSAVGG